MRLFGDHSGFKSFRRTIAIVMIFTVLFSGSINELTGVKKVWAAGAPLMKIDFVRWTKLYEMPKEDFYGLLMPDWNGEHYFTNGSDWGPVDGHGQGWRLTNITSDPYMNSGEVFYTKGLMNTPYFIYGGTDSDNNDARKYLMLLYSGDRNSTGKYVDYTGFQIQKNSWDSSSWMTILDKKRAEEKGIGDKVVNGDNIIFWNTALNDTALKRELDLTGKLCAHGVSSEGDDTWTATRWQVYRATKIYYSCIYTWTIDKNQVWTVSDDVILMDGETLTIPENTVLCVKKGNFLVNGTIKCYGTMIVEDGAAVIPFMPKKKGGNIEIIGGNLLIMSGGRVYTGNPKGVLGATEDAMFTVENGGTVVNYGVLAAGHANIRDNCLVENHAGGTILLGVKMDRTNSFMLPYNPGDKISILGMARYYSGSIKASQSAAFKSYPGSYLLTPSSASDELKWKTYTYDTNGNVNIK